ncbi:hypothetical protein PssiTeo3_07000 [Pseudomonas sichuanensis]|nr:hypothetical protein [Pseudomonas sichuanensis]
MFSYVSQHDYRIAGEHQRTLADAFSKYLKDNYAAVLTNAGAGHTVIARFALQEEHQLSKARPPGQRILNWFTVVDSASRSQGFPTIAFLQTGYNVYTLQQAARRSWRIGQKHPVRVVFFGYTGSSQITCLQLMAKKIAVAQSTSGNVPKSGLDSMNEDGDSVEMALARQLITA